ncbi:MAG: PQQ-dependent sugar dehydrogenase [Oscillochloris sp.]|nr:PQQ-dependent sugar dehydrogenase [Oscillochloris sp.]
MVSHRLRTHAVTSTVFLALLLILVLGGVIRGGAAQATQNEETFDWRTDWAVAEGFTMEPDSSGYSLPAAIAFVPEPGPDPKDPLYFVTELRGKLKVVTNDRSVYTFAENFLKFVPEEELPAGRGQGGEAGLCLDPPHGYIFATFLYTNDNGSLRNNIVRYSTTPGTFGLGPVDHVVFTDVFKNYESGLAHHIGPCQVVGDELFVGIGEAWQPHLAQDPNAMVGKIYRMDLDGRPLPDNPFYEDDDITKARNYVWATGLRNPYSLKVIDGRVFVADNGLGTDRFVEVQAGEDYGWNGVESSIHKRADFIWAPSLGPTQLQFLPPNSTLLDGKYDGQFFVGMTGSSRPNRWPGVQNFPYDFERGMLTDVPKYFLRWRGSGEQMLVGVAFGPDGLYVVPTYANEAGDTSIYRIIPDPTNSYPYKPTQTNDPIVLIREKGCLGCHRIGSDGGFGGTAGPDLSRELLLARVQARLENEQYRQNLVALNQLEQDPYIATRLDREAVLAAKGEEAAQIWVEAQIREPLWDTRASAMPNMNISRQEAEIITEYLLRDPEESQGFTSFLPQQLRSRTSWVMFAGGLIIGAIGMFTGNWIRRRWKESHRHNV